ncbi:hypothetical protein HPB49_022451 [Dermacentor silvarum]|uniref:Uncharacterized protein n=1 Tax=Dermacentor silvarum TaxID=543639 RepID=A0ACB8CHN6_DERSI|nr:hypothetical protein HPB49_022451 [Dermacentor silvarum]
MRIRQKLEYHKQRDAFVGDVDMGSELEHLTPNSETETLANSVFCFLLCGLHAKYKIPVGYFFTKGCTGEQLKEVIDHVVQKATDIGFDIVRVVTDNHRINVTAMQILCQGDANITAPQPADSSNSIFLSFDQSHIIKNIRSQFLAKDIGGTKEISFNYIKMLYKMQRNSTVKPIRFLTRKHLYPSNVEKMNERSAVQLFGVAVTAALKYLKDQADHTCDLEFASAGPTIKFMEAMQKWFTLMDVSNCQQHIHCNNEDTRHFTDVDDSRLNWLEDDLLSYIDTLKNASKPENFLSKETCHALIFTTKSNVACIRHLLTAKCFRFVLTRKMSSDPIEAMFGFLRRSARCNDMLDVSRAVCGLEKMLKTGIVASSSDSNVQSSTTFSSRQLLPVQQELHELVKLLIGLRRFVDCVLPHRRSVAKPLELCVQRILRQLVSLPVLTCGNTDADHRRELLLLITRKFIRPLFSNFAQGVTDRNAAAKLLEMKTLSRKVLKL